MVSIPNDGIDLRIVANRPKINFSASIIVGLTAISEGFVTVALGHLIHSLYVLGEPEKGPLYVAATVIFTLFMMQAFSTLGLYRFSRILVPQRQIMTIIGVCVVLFLLFTAGTFAFKLSAEYSRVWAFAWLVTTIASVICVRFAVSSLVYALAASGRLGRNIVIYGGGSQAMKLIQHIETLREPWNRIVGVFDDRAERTGPFVSGYPVIGGIEKMLDWCRVQSIDEILIALPWAAQDRVLDLLHSFGSLPANVRLSPEFGDRDLHLGRLSNQFRVPMLSILEKPVSSWGGFSKHVLDYTVASISVVVLAPLILLVSACIKLDSPGPVLFRQKRYGFNNQLIEVFKFRTMYTDQTDENADTLATREDPRVTKVGGILRRFSIDELPQIFNVLRGDMSIVGPRPHALRAKAGDVLYADVIDQYAVRHKVKPGITGWAQVNGWRGETRDEASLLGRVEHDLYYIDHWSLLFDLSIILRTFFVVIRGDKNSY
jgi:Undecaprenyl-phosphate glucose phosphotransferase